MTEVERLEQELAIAKRKERLEREIRSAKCPLCGANLTYSIHHTPHDGGYTGVNSVRIYCDKCKCFGINQSYSHDYTRSCNPQNDDVDDLCMTWHKIEKYAIKETEE